MYRICNVMLRYCRIPAILSPSQSPMPSAALRPCSENRCPALVRGGRCPDHGGPTPAWRTDHSADRIRGRRLQHLRATLFMREPLCRTCVQAGRTTIATIRDHVVPLAEGGRDVASNEQPICADCHEAKTQAESMRGRKRSTR